MRLATDGAFPWIEAEFSGKISEQAVLAMQTTHMFAAAIAAMQIRRLLHRTQGDSDSQWTRLRSIML
jgi:hypothetical protein